MRLLDLVEQDNGVGFAADLLRQLAALRGRGIRTTGISSRGETEDIPG